MVTDTRRKRRSDAGVPEDCPVYAFHQSFSKDAEVEEVSLGCRQAAIGCVECKRILIANLNQFLDPFRQRRTKYENTDLTEILAAGSSEARQQACDTLENVRQLMKI
jgi:tryptophanyl-tRNA synthetase